MNGTGIGLLLIYPYAEGSSLGSQLYQGDVLLIRHSTLEGPWGLSRLENILKVKWASVLCLTLLDPYFT